MTRWWRYWILNVINIEHIRVVCASATLLVSQFETDVWRARVLYLENVRAFCPGLDRAINSLYWHSFSTVYRHDSFQFDRLLLVRAINSRATHVRNVTRPFLGTASANYSNNAARYKIETVRIEFRSFVGIVFWVAGMIWNNFRLITDSSRH